MTVALTDDVLNPIIALATLLSIVCIIEPMNGDISGNTLLLSSIIIIINNNYYYYYCVLPEFVINSTLVIVINILLLGARKASGVESTITTDYIETGERGGEREGRKRGIERGEEEGNREKEGGRKGKREGGREREMRKVKVISTLYNYYVITCDCPVVNVLVILLGKYPLSGSGS